MWIESIANFITQFDMVIFAIFGNGICGGLVLLFTILIASLLFKSKQFRNKITQSSVKDRSDQESKITVMLFIVACLFILTKIPEIVIVQIIISYTGKSVDQHNINAMAAWPVTNVLLIINHSVNFVIYVVFFKKFKEVSMRIFKKGKEKCKTQGSKSRSLKYTGSTALEDGATSGIYIVSRSNK